MSQTSTLLNTLSPAVTETSSEIQQWAAQFPDGQRATAKLMLSCLKFVSRDIYSAWLRRAVAALPGGKVYALYSIRKLYATQKYGLAAAAEHEKFDSAIGFYNHLAGLIAFVKDVDAARWQEFHKQFSKIPASTSAGE